MFTLTNLLTLAVGMASLGTASAKIYSVSVPDTALVGSTIDATLYSEGYVQNWDDFGAIWGLVRPGQNSSNAVGTEVGYQNLYGDTTYPSDARNRTYAVTLPNVPTGEYTFVAAVPYLVGASGETGINYFHQTINLVDNVKRRRNAC